MLGFGEKFFLSFSSPDMCGFALPTLRHGNDKVANQLHLASLIGSLHLTINAALPIDLVFVSNGANTGDHVLQVSHRGETCGEAVQSGWADKVTHQLPNKAHNQQSRRNNPTKANPFTHLRISMHGVKVTRGPRVANQLQVRDRGLHQRGQGFTDLDVFVIPVLAT
jgi:hypothetical protein